MAAGGKTWSKTYWCDNFSPALDDGSMTRAPGMSSCDTVRVCGSQSHTFAWCVLRSSELSGRILTHTVTDASDLSPAARPDIDVGSGQCRESQSDNAKFQNKRAKTNESLLRRRRRRRVTILSGPHTSYQFIMIIYSIAICRTGDEFKEAVRWTFIHPSSIA